MRIYFIMPNNAYIYKMVIEALEHFGYNYVEIDRGLFVTPEAYNEAIAPGFVNLMDLPIDGNDPYDLLAVGTTTTDKSREVNPQLYEKLLAL